MSEAIENLSVILLTLRNKLLVIAAVLFTGIIISFQFTSPLITRMKTDLLPEGAKLVYVSPLEVMMLELKLSIIIGLLITLPIIAFYVYRAISKKYSVRIPITIGKGQFIFLSLAVIVMFIFGAAYAYFLMLPLFLKFLSPGCSRLRSDCNLFDLQVHLIYSNNRSNLRFGLRTPNSAHLPDP